MSPGLDRREFIAASALAGAYAVGGRAFDRLTTPSEARRIALAIVDDSDEAGRVFARSARRAGIPTISIAEEEASLWSRARRGFGLAHGEAAIGFTRWSDWSALRPAFAEHRKRARVELRVDGYRDDLVRDLLAAGRDGAQVHRSTTGTGGATRFAWLVA